MANEARITASLSIRAGNVQYLSQPQTFQATVTGRKGPTPGAITATTEGTVVDLSQLTTPGLCRLMNLDPTNYVEWGPYDSSSARFYPLGELLPGETFPIRLSRFLGQEFGTGSGTGNLASDVSLMVKGIVADCPVLVEAFEV